MRMLAVYHKEDKLAFISHLDIQRSLQRAMRRAKIPLAYSEGFNPHPKLSFASALATGQMSDAEWFEVELEEAMEPEDFVSSVNTVMPEGFFFSDAVAAPERFPSLSALTRAAEYAIKLELEQEIPKEAVTSCLDALLEGAIVMAKKTKSGVRDVDIRPEIMRVFVEKIEGRVIALRVLGKLQADGGLRADLFVRAFLDRLDAHADVSVRRTNMYFAGDGLLPQLPPV